MTSFTAAAQMGGITVFLVGCRLRPLAGFPVPPRSRLLCLRAGIVEPRNSATGQVSILLMWTTSINAFTVAFSVDHGRGLPSSHCSHLTKNWQESLWTFHRRLIMRTGVIRFSRTVSWVSSAPSSNSIHCMCGHESPNRTSSRRM